MTTYTLVVLFDKTDLKCINQARQKVVLIREISDGSYQVAWVTFTPFERNLITWNNDYFLYVSPTVPTEDQPILTVGIQEVQAQNSYTFNKDRTFSAPQSDPTLHPSQYMVVNDLPSQEAPLLTFGMAQACNINSQATKPLPIHATVVPSKHFARFTPQNTLLIFLATNILNSTVHNNVKLESNSFYNNRNLKELGSRDGVESLATKLNFTTESKCFVKYSSLEGKFIQQPLSF